MVCERHGDWKVIREERAACRMGQSSYHIHVLCIYINLYKNIYIYIYMYLLEGTIRQIIQGDG